MKKIALVGDIGSGKTFFSKLFKVPVFNADYEVSNLYKKDKNLFKKIKKKFPNSISKPPLKKDELSKIILENPKNLKFLGKLIHKKIRSKMKKFFLKNKGKKLIVLDIPLFLENKINKEKDLIVFIDANKKKIMKNLKKRKNINLRLINVLRSNQMSLKKKKSLSSIIVKNNFRSETAKKSVKLIMSKIKT